MLDERFFIGRFLSILAAFCVLVDSGFFSTDIGFCRDSEVRSRRQRQSGGGRETGQLRRQAGRGQGAGGQAAALPERPGGKSGGPGVEGEGWLWVDIQLSSRRRLWELRQRRRQQRQLRRSRCGAEQLRQLQQQ